MLLDERSCNGCYFAVPVSHAAKAVAQTELCHSTPIICCTGLATVDYEIDSLLLHVLTIRMKDSKGNGCQRSLFFDVLLLLKELRMTDDENRHWYQIDQNLNFSGLQMHTCSDTVQ